MVLICFVERMNTAHTLTVQEVLRYYKSDENVGLSDEQVSDAQARYGPNGKLIIIAEVYCFLPHLLTILVSLASGNIVPLWPLLL